MPVFRRPPRPPLRSVVPALLRLMALGLVAAASAVHGQPLSLGVLPVEGPLETRNDWVPLVTDLSRALGQPARLLTPTSYDAMASALQQGDIDLTMLSGQLAIDAVTRYGMTVVARGLPADADRHRTLLIVRRGATPATLDQMLALPAKWRLARGEVRSFSGYLVPQLQLFLPRGLRMEAFFATEVQGSHQTNALAVANGEADVGLTTGSDLARFKERFPMEYARLAVLWRSDPLPAPLVVARRALPEAVRARLAAHLAALGQTRPGQEQLARHDLAGFEAAGDAALLDNASLVYRFDRQSALQGSWTDESARRARLARIEQEYASLRATLDAPPRRRAYAMPTSSPPR
ncbi:phosphate/phosphite/phosphonate ABC transporter substrate-binding protein [Pigmentiphaga sp.]|uniref:phosphate/phosphite/phosphonate ABC transporter substrate-binding protein n=1 Tax=Pigmentiphaga sp. TaxID=1977564 RepID=UPI00128BF307|nr:phosphate/phosphite/phosphonate ABC transporter substrate-binding protein [Pigmentiphaga sp.]MPS26664.1 phosphate/phosphite/phosphonate ABC transporter substrate-binding protein [Alcaligenaceae bacterium SAGV5]MPS53690.1 phosphate/phosphite/phosphonate ABC transporter substrate-binding protein [Alcaligenaceae bacterium SAGV3]MPT59239.1 phosphate/phosphite/phosphonate ABC transporter substrate-binding protein [Alcaligenaceae bacterium]